MAVLPSGGLDLSAGVQFERQPSLTWYLDQAAGRIRGTADGLEAVRQAVEVILNVERFRWQIYLPYSGMQWNGLIGRDAGYVAAELRRRVSEALLMDDRVRGVSEFSYSVKGEVLTATLTVSTVYGDIQTSTEVIVT